MMLRQDANEASEEAAYLVNNRELFIQVLTDWDEAQQRLRNDVLRRVDNGLGVSAKDGYLIVFNPATYADAFVKLLAAQDATTRSMGSMSACLPTDLRSALSASVVVVRNGE